MTTKRSAEDLRAAILERSEKAEQVEDIDANLAEAEDMEDGELTIEDFMEDALDQAEVSDLIEELYQDGFASFVDGIPEEECPCEDPAEADIWLEGWTSGYTHACVSDLILSVKALLEADDEKGAEAAMARIEEGFTYVSECVNLEEAQEFLDELRESGTEAE